MCRNWPTSTCWDSCWRMKRTKKKIKRKGALHFLEEITELLNVLDILASCSHSLILRHWHISLIFLLLLFFFLLHISYISEGELCFRKIRRNEVDCENERGIKKKKKGNCLVLRCPSSGAGTQGKWRHFPRRQHPREAKCHIPHKQARFRSSCRMSSKKWFPELWSRRMESGRWPSPLPLPEKFMNCLFIFMKWAVDPAVQVSPGRR